MLKSKQNYILINNCKFFDNDYVFIRCLRKHFYRTINSFNYALFPYKYFGTIRFINNEWCIYAFNRYDKITDLIICDCTRDFKNEK